MKELDPQEGEDAPEELANYDDIMVVYYYEPVALGDAQSKNSGWCSCLTSQSEDMEISHINLDNFVFWIGILYLRPYAILGSFFPAFLRPGDPYLD